MTAYDGTDAEWVASLTPFRDALEAALAEAGYPDVSVVIEWSGVVVDGAPQHIIDKAVAVCCGIGG